MIKPPSLKTTQKDRERANEIVRNTQSISWPKMRENVADLVARALAEGREEGIRIAQKRTIP
jgi:hypothetical protein